MQLTCAYQSTSLYPTLYGVTNAKNLDPVETHANALQLVRDAAGVIMSTPNAILTLIVSTAVAITLAILKVVQNG